MPPKSSDRSDSKRARLSPVIHENETIEKKILDGDYASFEDVLGDVKSLTPSILDENMNGTFSNGTAVRQTSKAEEGIATIQDFLMKASHLHTENVKQEGGEGETEMSLSHDTRTGGQVLTVRTQTSTGPRQVFSGLQRSARLETQGADNSVMTVDIAAPIDLRKLPNGFDIVEPSSLGAHMKRNQEKHTRTLGEVFAPSRNAVPLEAPRPSKTVTRGKSLDFVSASEALFAHRADAIFKSDHVYSTLPTGQWLRYNQDQAKGDGAFQAAYSSFAPSHDDSSAVIPQRTRSDLWWERRRQRRSRPESADEYPEDVLIQTMSANILEDDFADAVAEFQQDDTNLEEFLRPDTEMNDVDDVLREVSDLLQTLSSYQRSRDAELSRVASFTPSASEFDTYEILKSQLSVLVNTLPPFAVAKLDGDQLKELNINTTLTTIGNDYPGVGEPDDAELQRRRAKAAAAMAASRTPAPVQTAARPTAYQAPATNYQQRTPAYTPTPAPYARPAQYQTPRPPSAVAQRPAYPQAQYGTTPAYSQPTSLQQFQRPLPNGYPSYGSTTPQVAQYASQQKPMVNGHRPSTYGNSAPAASPPKVPTLTPQQQMLQERQAQAIRMANGSANPGYGQYDGTGEKRSETPKTEVKAE